MSSRILGLLLLLGACAEPMAPRVLPESLDLGTVEPGVEASASFSVENPGRAPVSFLMGLNDGGAFDLADAREFELASGAGRILTVTGQSTGPGAHAGLLIVTWDGGEARVPLGLTVAWAGLDGDRDGVPFGEDCDDEDAGRYPGATETCDGLDEDCSGVPDDAGDQDGDGSSSCEDCDDGSPDRWPGAPELCNGIDDDCSTDLPEDEQDQDQDGSIPCLGDCDDGDATVFPGAPETCDGRDEDCSGEVDDALDQDGDGSLLCDDCDDADPSRRPGLPELCTGVDENCDGVLLADEVDGDGDGFIPCADDCDDGAAATWPGAPELCDGLDQDCDGVLPVLEVDGDGDGVLACGGDCDDTDASRFQGAAELCDGLDQDCDGLLPADEVDGDGDGQRPCALDCDDAAPLVWTGAPEICDGIDDDCSLDVPVAELDVDGDGFVACDPWLGGPALQGGDCGPTLPATWPGAPEICDGLDQDCDNVVPADELDLDGDGFVECTSWSGDPALAGGDCAPTNSSVRPGSAELCDGLDQDCDGAPDPMEVDGDGDGYVECEPWMGGAGVLGGDCDDLAADINPGAPERCDGLDNDCVDGLPLDEADVDADGQMACEGDCDDSVPEVGVGMPELCDTQDNDCDLLVDEDWDQDLDGWVDETGVGCAAAWGSDAVDCDDGDDRIYPGSTELCDGVDQDCDGAPGDDELDQDGDGVAPCEGDCDDGDGLVSPDLPEVSCNGIDDDCDTVIDPGQSYEEFFMKARNQATALRWVSDFALGFASPVPHDPPGSGTVYGPVLGDFDGDSDLDFLLERVPSWPSQVKVHLYRSDCMGSFTESSLESVGMDLDGLAADIHTTADLDLDGDLDILGWDWSDGDGIVWLGDGTANTWTRIPATFGNEPRPFLLDSWNPSDGDVREWVAEPPVDVAGTPFPDLVECWTESSTASTSCRIHTGDGDGTFTEASTFTVSRRCNGGAVADFDGDGWMDLVCGLDDDGDAGQAWIWFGTGPTFAPSGNGVPSFDLWPDSSTADQDDPGYGWIYPWDWDWDGDIDLVSTTIATYSSGNTDRTIQVLSNSGNGQFTATSVGSTQHSYSGSYWVVMDEIGVPVFP